jgi:hypothetical protein
VFSLAALAVGGAALWLAPTVLVLTSLRDRPLAAALAGIAGSVTSGSARWDWLGSVEFRDVVIRDRTGRALVLVPAVIVEKGILALVARPRDLGVVRLVAPEAIVEVRRGGSSLEDLLAPWLAGLEAAGPTPRLDVEVVDATIELVDVERGDAWRIEDLAAVAGVEPGGLAGWTVGGRVRHAGQVAPEAGPARAASPRATGAAPLDRTAVAARATAALTRDGGFSASSSAAAEPRTMALAGQRLPLGISSVVATRWDTPHLVDGLADVRLDTEWLADRTRIAGMLTVDELAVFRADTLAELATIGRCEMPFDLAVHEGAIAVRTLSARSPLFRAEASGRIRLPDGGSWAWAEELAAADFAVSGEIDLAATSRSVPGGLTVRPDVRVTAGTLEVAAAARPDGDDRVLEVRAAARDLAAVQAATGDRAERPLRWTEPFVAWLRGRSGRAVPFRIEEGRLTSAALELSAAGTAAASTVDWTLDLERLAAEAAEIVDLGGLEVAGSSRGRLDVRQAEPGSPTVVTARMDLADFALAAPGRPAWKDAAMSIEAEATGVASAGIALMDRGHVVVVAGDDRLEATLTGRVAVDPGALVAGSATVRPALADGAGEAVAADCSLVGDLGRWHARLAPFLPLVPGLAVGGRVEASAAVAARDDAWQITRAGGEIEKFTLEAPGRRIAEPRIVASAAGSVHPVTGRIDVSSAEVLSATLSARTGGLSWSPAADFVPVRGRLQWQADAGRFARWLVPAETADRWPTAGRAWGTCEVADASAGTFLRLEATADGLVVSDAKAGNATPQPPRPLWAEPRATLVLEVSRPTAAAGADPRLVIDRLAVESTTFSLAASGGVDEPSSRRVVDLGGTLSYDWEQVSRLLVPWTAGRLRLVGAGGRPFAIRAALGGPPAPAAAAPPPPAGVALPLPDDRLAAARGGPAAAAARLTIPAAATGRGELTVAERLRTAAVETSIAWQSGEISGVPLAAGEVPVRLVEGQLAIGPFDIAAAGGRIRAAPWMTLASRPRELVVPPGRIVDRVAISGAQGRRIASWLSPLVGHATQAEGAVSIDLAGARLPLDDPFAGEASGQVVFDPLEVVPAATVQPLVNLLVRLQSAVDPRFALGEKRVLLRVRPDPVRVRLTGRRLWHEGLVLDTGAWTIESGGSVGADGSLSMVVEVALRGDLAGQAPVVAQIMRTPLVIPLTGTVDRPTFDARAIDLVVGRIVENTAQAVINDGIGRGLEALFGSPAPAPDPAPLTLPR